MAERKPKPKAEKAPKEPVVKPEKPAEPVPVAVEESPATYQGHDRR